MRTKLLLTMSHAYTAISRSRRADRAVDENKTDFMVARLELFRFPGGEKVSSHSRSYRAAVCDEGKEEDQVDHHTMAEI
jgi:hypothetical protein